MTHKMPAYPYACMLLGMELPKLSKETRRRVAMLVLGEACIETWAELTGKTRRAIKIQARAVKYASHEGLMTVIKERRYNPPADTMPSSARRTEQTRLPLTYSHPNRPQLDPVSIVITGPAFCPRAAASTEVPW